MDQFKFHDMTLHFLEGNQSYIDGGKYFGPVPRVVWGKKMPYDENNNVSQTVDPILIQYQGHNILIDAGFGNSKYSDKMIRNEGIQSENMTIDSLGQLGLTPEDIDIILMSHLHNDHVGGLSRLEDGKLISNYPNATIYINDIEWDEVRRPNDRTKGTYLKENWEPIQDQVVTFSDHLQVMNGIEMNHMGGHSNGISNIILTQNGEKMIHLSDNFMTHWHINPLYVTALDDYPMDTIAAKKKWLLTGIQEGAYFFFYHDPYYTVIQWDTDGKEMLFAQERSKTPLIPLDKK